MYHAFSVYSPHLVSSIYAGTLAPHITSPVYGRVRACSAHAVSPAPAPPRPHPAPAGPQTQDMEEYLDCLLVRIMESSPQLLQSPSKPAGTGTKYSRRAS